MDTLGKTKANRSLIYVFQAHHEVLFWFHVKLSLFANNHTNKWGNGWKFDWQQPADDVRTCKYMFSCTHSCSPWSVGHPMTATISPPAGQRSSQCSLRASTRGSKSWEGSSLSDPQWDLLVLALVLAASIVLPSFCHSQNNIPIQITILWTSQRARTISH